jgi:hypothetical protein
MKMAWWQTSSLRYGMHATTTSFLGGVDIQASTDRQGNTTSISDWVKRKILQQQIWICVKTFGARSFIIVVAHHLKDSPTSLGWMVVAPSEGAVRLLEVRWPARSGRRDLTCSSLRRLQQHDQQIKWRPTMLPDDVRAMMAAGWIGSTKDLGRCPWQRSSINLLKYPDSRIEAYNVLMYQSLDQSLVQYII